MKKIKCFSLFLSLILILQCVLLPASAIETTDPQQMETVLETNAPIEAEDIPFGQVCVQKGCRSIKGMVPLGGSDRRLETAQSVFLYEVNTDTVVYSYNPDVKVHPGTLAKIVLAMVVLERSDMDDVVTVTEGIQSYIPAGANSMQVVNGSKVDSEKLKSNEHISVGDLLYGVLMINANDAAVALAHHIAGTTGGFLTLMNDKVKQLGCSNTEFGNISGLYTGQSYSTARDMAIIMREAMRNPDFVTITGTGEHTVPATDLASERTFKTQNYMVDDSTIQDFYDGRVTGGMATYHETTGASIVITANDKSNEEDTIYLNYIAVVLGATRVFAENGWQPINHGNFNEMSVLLNYGFDNFKVNRIIYDGMSLNQFPVNGGESYAVGQAKVDIDSVVPKAVQMNNLQMNYTVTDGGLSAPVKKDDMIATLQVQYRNSVITEVEVFAMGDVKSANNTGVTIRSTAVRSDSDDSGILSVIGTVCVIVLGLAVVYLAFNAYMRSRMRARRKKRRADRRRIR